MKRLYISKVIAISPTNKVTVETLDGKFAFFPLELSRGLPRLGTYMRHTIDDYRQCENVRVLIHVLDTF